MYMLFIEYIVAALFGIQSLCQYKIRVMRALGQLLMQILRLLFETLGIFHVPICVCAFASSLDLFSKINS